MQLNMEMVDIMTDPVKARDFTASALRHYDAMKQAQKRYYEKNREAILTKYRDTHPNPRPRGRPKKVVGGGSSETSV